MIGSLSGLAGAAAGAAGAAGAGAGAAAAITNPAGAAGAAAAAAANTSVGQSLLNNAGAAAGALGLQSELDKLKAALGLQSAICTKLELIDPEIDDDTVIEADTRVYQPMTTSDAWFGFLYMHPTKPPPKYQLDNKNALWRHVLFSAASVIITGTLIKTLKV